MKKKYFAWLTDAETILKVYELARKRGKKTGDNIQQEFFEVIRKANTKATPLGSADSENLDALMERLRKEVKRRKDK
jgi:hypothetical protein